MKWFGSDNHTNSASIKGNYWPKDNLSKDFHHIGGNQSQRNYVERHGEEVAAYFRSRGAKVTFTFHDNPIPGSYGIGYDPNGGAWSCLGRNCRSRVNEQAMNFGFLSPITVHHEFMHFYNALHTHQIPGAFDFIGSVVYAATARTGWSKAQTDFNIMNDHDPQTVDITEYHERDKMSYKILASWNRAGRTSNPSIEWLPIHDAWVDKHLVEQEDEIEEPPVDDCQELELEFEDLKRELEDALFELSNAKDDVKRKQAVLSKLSTFKVQYSQKGAKLTDAVDFIDQICKELGL